MDSSVCSMQISDIAERRKNKHPFLLPGVKIQRTTCTSRVPTVLGKNHTKRRDNTLKSTGYLIIKISRGSASGGGGG